MRAGLLAGLLAFPLHTLLLTLAGEADWKVMIRGGLLGSIVLVLIGAVVGRLRDLGERVKQELAERKRAEEKIRQRTAQLEALRQVGLELTAELNLDALLRSIVSRAIELMEGTAGGLYLYRPDRDVLEWSVPVGPHLAPGGIVLHRGEGLAGKVWETGEPLIVDDSRHWEGRAASWESYPVMAVVSVPVRWGEEFLGVLDVYRSTPRAFSSADAELLSLFASQAAIAIENARLYQAEKRRRRDAEVLRQTALALTSALDRNQVIGRILSQLQEVVPYDNASVQLLQGNRLVIIGGRGFPNLEEILGISFPVDGDNPNREVMRTLSPFILEDAPAVYDDFRREPHAQANIHSFLGVPMLIGKRPVGMIALGKCQPGFYTKEHAHLAQAFAAQAAIAIENARLFEEEERRSAQLAAISEVARDITSLLDLDKLLHRVVESLVETFGYYYANVLIVDEEAEEIVLTASAGQTGRAFEGFRLKIGEQGITGWVARSGEPLLVNDVDNEPRYQFVEELADTKSELAVPIKLKGKVIGVLDVQSNEAGAFDEMDLSTLVTLADQLAVAIENARLYESVQQELTKRKRAEEKLKETLAELERSNRELEQFAYVASHDLQEPLRMVSSFTQLLARRYKDKLDADANEFITYAVDGANRMQKMISDLLTYSRVGTRGKPFEPICCEAVLDQAVTNLQVAIEESGAVVTHDPLPTLMADGTQLVQLFQNLIGNAIKFRSDVPPEIHIGVERTDSEWRFSVRDNGIGIDPQHHDRIFMIFQRLHSREEYPGTGIGLAICKRIVERHGGRIWVESQPGKGATFYFTIPARGDNHEWSNDRRTC
jgi:signal transduction histidine kinase